VVNIVIASADYTPDGGGIGAYANGLWRGLAQAGCEASVLSRFTPARLQTQAERMIRVDAGGSAARNLSALGAWYSALRQEVIARKCDWAIVPTWDPVALAALLPVLRRALPCRLAVIFHGADVASAQGRKARLLRYVMKSADRLIANSSFTRALIAGRFGATCATVRPAIGEDDLDAAEAEDTPHCPQNVISIGRLVPRKGHSLVLEAVARLRSAYPAISYTIVGEGAQRARLESMARELGIGDRVHLTGHVRVEEKRRLLRAASIFALPVVPDESDPEGFGIAYLEAGAAGLPVVATRSGGVTECVRSGVSGLFCEPSVAGVARALGELLANPALRLRLGQGGRSLAESSIWKNRAQDLLRALDEAPLKRKAHA
jgi:phosphatidylinositol alpha-1,6-mannosyltransferase